MKSPKGKCFSGCNRGQRRKSDLYETPLSITRQLLDFESFSGTILEPAQGNGAIVKVLRANGWGPITCYDVEKDFLKERRRFENVVTNPPYSLAQEFILKAKEVATEKIAMLLPLSYLHGVERYRTIYQDREFPLKRIYVFTRYPMLGDKLREDGCYRTGMVVYQWMIFAKHEGTGEPVIRWIDNDKYVLRKGSK
jgi:hypothetical protein